MSDYLSGISTAPGRVRTFKLDPEKGTSPHSCVLSVYKNNLFDLIKTTALDLKGGAGVKIVLDRFEKRSSVKASWCFYLSPEHPDYEKMTALQEYHYDELDELHDPRDVYINVEDSMLSSEGTGIIESWAIFINSISSGKSICLDLSKLRPAGETNDKGLVATGPVGYGKDNDNHSSFWAVYYYIAQHLEKGDIYSLMQLLGCINDTLRRGGFKRGIVCSSLNYKHPDFLEYITCDITKIPGSHKKAVSGIDEAILYDVDLVQKICDATNAQGVFWERQRDDNRYLNVCQGIAIKDRGTCLIWRENLGLCTNRKDLIDGKVQATLDLCHLHVNWRDKVDQKSPVLELEKDNQIGVDVLGLANMLRIWGVTYKEFNQALVNFINNKVDSATKAAELVDALAEAYRASTKAADDFMDSLGLPRLDFIHTVEPAQSHSYECKDVDGFTTVRGIWPPFARRTRRRSNTQKNIVVKFGDVEVATDFDPDFNFILSDNYYRFMKLVGRPHGISVDDWGVATPDRLAWWVKELDLPSKYYSESNTYKEQSALRKRAVVTDPIGCSIANPGTCAVCEE